MVHNCHSLPLAILAVAPPDPNPLRKARLCGPDDEHPMARTLLFRLLIVLFALYPLTLPAQAQPGPGYALRTLDGDNDLGEYFAVIPRSTPDNWVGFFYMADEQRLFSASCNGLSCSINRPMTATGNRGSYVSAALRPVGGNPIVSYYNLSDGDLMLVACVDSTCSVNATERTLDSVGNVGQGTAIAVDPSTGFAVIAYYDVSNADLKVYRCTAADCSSGSAVTADASGTDRGRNPSVGFGSGALWVAYDDSSTGEVRLGFSLPPYTVFNSFSLGPGTDPSLTIDSSGFADVVFRGGASSTLERVRCLNAACSSSAQQTLQGAGRGYTPSATRLPNGNLLVSHQEPGNGTVWATLCNDGACTAPNLVVMDSGQGFGGNSVALTYANGRALVHFRDSVRADIRVAGCTTPACSAFNRRTALNGVVARGARVALRSDGRAVSVWQRTGSGLQVALATCPDLACSIPARRQLLGGNGDNSSRPAVAVRPDGRPFAFYSSFGGTEAFDCGDSDCSSGTPRSVSGFGNSTGQVTEMALRSDGRPVMVYTRADLADVYAFVCADINCSSGVERLISNEPDQSVESTQLGPFAVQIGSGNRLIVLYGRSTQPSPGNFVNVTRFVRCDDTDCSSASVRTVSTDQPFFGLPLAVRSDGRPLFVEYNNSPRALASCDNADCSSVTRFPLTGVTDIHYGMGLRSGDFPVFDGGTIGSIGAWVCNSPSCSSPLRSTLISDTGSASRQLYGPLVLNASGQAVVAAEETELADVYLAVPMSNSVFANGFE
jgi:hypothetical protein